MIPIFVFIGLLLFMICVLMAPSAVNDAMRWRIPVNARPSPPRYPHFPVILIFLLGIGLFYEIGLVWPAKSLPPLDSFQFCSSLFGAVFLAANGGAACFWPLKFMRFFVQPLRKVPDFGIDPRTMNTIVIVAKTFGVIFLLASAFVVHLIAMAS